VFLTNPTIDELKGLDMPDLMDMLAYQSKLLVELLKEEGFGSAAKSCKECMINIQTVIKMKRSLEKPSSDTSSNISFIQDATR
jgi:hypothetical protein